MTSLRPLAFKVIRGAGRLDIARLVLLVGGIAVCVLSIIFAVLLPGVFDQQRERQANRTAEIAFDVADEASLTHITLTQELYGSRQLSRVLVSTVSGGSRPPGVTALPAPGHLVVSPALQSALDRDPSLKGRFRGIVDGVIGDEGLVAPDELFAYVGVDGVSGTAVAHFGSPVGAIWSNGDGPALAIELLILFGLPAIGFLTVSFRLSMTSRMTRLRALRLVGLTAAECARIFAWELAATSIVGSLIAVLVYNPLQEAFGSSTATGFSWFGVDGTLPVVGMVIVWLVSVTVAYAVGYRTALGQLRSSVEIAPRPSSALGRNLRRLLAAAALFSAGVVSWLLITLPHSANDSAPSVILTIYGSTAVLVAAGLVFVPRAAARLAGAVSMTSLPASMRLGFRLARYHRAGAFLTITAVAMLILVSGLSSAFIQSLIATTQGDGRSVVVDIALDDLPANERSAVLAETKNTLGFVSIPATTAQKNAFNDNGATIFVGDCATIATAMSLSPEECGGHSGGRLDVATTLTGDGVSTTLAAGTELQVALADGQSATVVAPEQVIRSDPLVAYFGLIISRVDAPWLSRSDTATVHFSVDSGGATYDRLLNAIAGSAPHSAPLTQFKDNDSFVLFGHQKGILDFGVIGGLVLAILALGVSGFSQRIDQRRSTAALRMLGVSARTVRVASVVQKSFPVLLAVAYFSAISLGLGLAFIFATGTETDVVGAIVARVVLSALAAVFASAVVGFFALGGSHTIANDSRE